jgi:hypothetical protein
MIELNWGLIDSDHRGLRMLYDDLPREATYAASVIKNSRLWHRGLLQDHASKVRSLFLPAVLERESIARTYNAFASVTKSLFSKKGVLHRYLF